MRNPHVFLVDDTGQTFPPRIESAVTVWLSRLKMTFPTLDETAVVDVLEEAARRLVRREARGGPLDHIHAYAWAAIRSVALSRLRLGRERVVQMTVQRPQHMPKPAGRGAAGPALDLEARVLLRQVLSQLTSIERRVFSLKVAGFSTREIAAHVGRAPATIDSIHSRAMARLRALAQEATPSRSRGEDR